MPEKRKKPTAKAGPKKTKKASDKRHTKKSVKRNPKGSSTKKTIAPAKKREKKVVTTQNNIVTIIGVAIVLVIIAVGAYFFFSGTQAANVAVVNGVPITKEQLDQQYSMLPPQYKAVLTKDMVLKQLVDEELLIQYAKKNGVVVNPEDVNKEIQSILSTSNMTLSQLQDNLGKFNLTIDDFENMIERKLYIQKAIDKIFGDLNEPSEDDIKEFYEQNKNLFTTPEQVTVRHILIALQRDNAASLAKELLDKVRKGADFCELVKEYTDDKGSKDSCGEYTFSRGQMVPEFENASFSLEPGESTMVQTQFGYHIIKKIADIPPRIKTLDEVKDQIKAQLLRQAQTNAYKAFVEQLRNESTIQVMGVN